jgi:hypothetical protein
MTQACTDCRDAPNSRATCAFGTPSSTCRTARYLCSVTQSAEAPTVSSLTERASNHTVNQLLNPSRMCRTPVVQHVLNLYTDNVQWWVPESYRALGPR